MKVIYCEVCGLSNKDSPHVRHRKNMNRVLCNAHWLQIRRHGKILERHRRSPQIFTIHEGHAELELINNKGEVVGIVLCDIEDVEKLS